MYIMRNRILPALDDLRVEHIDIEDIAHALSMQCRFNGITPHFYSVAEHSVLVSQFCDPGYQKAGLLHDAHEAYIGDITRPVKDIIGKDFLLLIDVIDNLIMKKFNVILNTAHISTIDDMVLHTEISKFFCSLNSPAVKSCWDMIQHFSPAEAKEYFLERWQNVQS